MLTVAEVARVVQWFHEHWFAHRNLSAENVLVASDGTVRLTLRTPGPSAPHRRYFCPATERHCFDYGALRQLLFWPEITGHGWTKDASRGFQQNRITCRLFVRGFYERLEC